MSITPKVKLDPITKKYKLTLVIGNSKLECELSNAFYSELKALQFGETLNEKRDRAGESKLDGEDRDRAIYNSLKAAAKKLEETG